MFLTTLSFIITTPGWEPSLGGFPALSGDVGEFLIKDFTLLGASIWTLADSLSVGHITAQISARSRVEHIVGRVAGRGSGKRSSLR